MNKITAWILALVLLCAPLTACGGQQSLSDGEASGQAAQEELGGIIHKLFADWYAYAIRCEYLYGDMLWSLSYLEPFFEDHSWGSLQTARAAQNLAQLRAEASDPPEASQMTPDDYNKLLQTGADVSAVQFAVDSLSTIKNALLLDHRNYRNCLNSPAEEIFLTYQLSNFENWASLIQQIYEIHLQICAIETDYMLLQVDNEEEEARLIEAITEKCPQINARRDGNPQEPDTLLENLDALLGETEQLINELTIVVGQAQAGLDRFSDTIDEADGVDNIRDYVAIMVANSVDLKDFPAALPYPDWWYEQENEEFLFTWKSDEGEERTRVLPGDAIETPPDEYFIKWPDVSLDEYQAYLETLERSGISAKFITEEEGEHIAFFQIQESSFALVWEESEVSLLTMEGSVCFAPFWYVLHHRQTTS